MSSDPTRVRNVVRDHYARIAAEAPAPAAEDSPGCAPAASCCGGGVSARTAHDVATMLGYSAADLADVPGGANMGLGCGNPHLLAALSAGEVVLDLGAGGGVDCFIAAKKVGPSGRVIGVDMTPAMVEKARAFAAAHGYANCEFRLGEIEHLPAGDNTADVILSNCVVNLSPDKRAVFREAFRVLRPGGRLAISDVVATCELPPEIRDDDALLSGCVAGAATIDELERALAAAGYVDATITPWDESRELIREWAPGRSVEDFVVSAMIRARKPGRAACC